MEGFPIQTNFTAGEVSPLLYGRVDVNKYFNGAQKVQNFKVKPQGALTRRSGTRYVGEVKTSSKLTVLRKFIFSVSQPYMLEFGDLYIRIYKNGALLLNAGNPVEVTTTYTEAELRDLDFTQSADVLYISHRNHPPATLSRVSDISWVLANISFVDGPYMDVDTSTNRIKIGVVTDKTTLISNASGDTTMIASSSLFVAGSVGKYVEYVKTNLNSVITWGLALVTAYTSGTNVAGTIQTNVFTPGVNATITFNGGTGRVVSNVNSFKTSHVGEVIRLTGSQVWYLITAYVSSTQAAATALNLVTYTYPLTTVVPQVGFASGDVGKYVEYKQNGFWKLGLILTRNSNTEVIIKVLDNIVIPPETVKINVPTGTNTTTSDATGIFGPGDVGKFVRDSDSQAWGLITVYQASDKVTTIRQTLFTYVYPGLTLTLLNDRIVRVTVDSNTEIFDITDTYLCIRLSFGAKWRYVTIDSVLSEKQALGKLNDFMPFDKDKALNPYNNGYADSFRMPAWSKSNLYPSVVFFHEERLGFAASRLNPLTSWLSKSADFTNYGPTDFDGKVLDDSAITETVASDEVNEMKWAVSSGILILGSNGAEFQTKASSVNQPLTPNNIAVVSPTAYGSVDYVKPIKIGSSVMFVQKTGTKLRELVYDYQQDSLVAHDLSVISDHIIRDYTSAIQSAYQKEPSIFWIATTGGALIGLTLEKDQEVVAWHRHILGGVFGSGIAVVESISSIPSVDGKTDTLYMIVKRTINGSTKRYVEYLEKDFETSLGNAGMFQVDCGLSYSGVAVNSVSGLSHLEGQTVQIVGDGTYRNTAVVASGAVTMSGAIATSIHVGLQYDSTLKTLPIESGSINGTAQGKMKRIHKIILRVFESIGFKYGPTEASLTPMAFTGNALFSGLKEFDLSEDYDRDAVYVIKQDKPLPLTILATMPQLQTYT